MTKQNVIHLRPRGSGKTKYLLTKVLELLETNERVLFCIHRKDFADYCKELLTHIGATPEQIARVDFVTLMDVDKCEGLVRPMVVDHHVVEQERAIGHD